MSASETAKTEEGSPPEETITPPVRPKRRTSWLWGVMAVVVLLGLVIAASLWAARPHWRTYVSPVDQASGLRISVQMPDNWTQEDRNPSSDQVILSFREKPPKGLSRWINEHLWRYNYSAWENDHIVFVLAERSGMDKDVATLEQTLNSLTRTIPNMNMMMNHVRYSLGSGLEFDTIGRPNSPNSTTYTIALFPDGSPAQRKIVTGLYCQAHSDHFKHIRSIFYEAARRIRIIDSLQISPRSGK